jgi:F-type H+-transporting ATPase subunit gamma
MAGGREIKTKIKSVQNTRKVTRALEMVSASKIRKAQDRMKSSRPYARAMKQVIGHLAQANSEYQHPYLVQRADVKRVGYIIVSSDRGLAGGLNNNLFRKLLGEIRKWQAQGVEVDVVTIGQKASVFFRRVKVEMLASVTHLGDQPRVEQLVGVIKVMLDAYSAGSIDKGYMDDIAINKIGGFEQALHAHFANTASGTMDKINATGDWNDDLEAAFKKGIEDFKATGTW